MAAVGWRGAEPHGGPPRSQPARPVQAPRQPDSSFTIAKPTASPKMTGMWTHIKNGRRRDGYTALAEWMSRGPDNEPFVFRGFKRLAARNTLHKQARLIVLEKKLDDLDDMAWLSKYPEIQQSSRRRETLTQNAACNQRVDKLDELDNLLKDYCMSFEDPRLLEHGLTRSDDTLMQQSQIAAMPQPRYRPLDTMRDFPDGTGARSETKQPSSLIAG